MARAFKPAVITANDLLEGDVVYLTADCGWTGDIEEAFVAAEEEVARRMLATAESQHSRVVGAYLAEVSVGSDGRPSPVHFREAFRTRGPSNYFHGKQAEV
ncbi:DUF2849 domain-containing protein [Oceanomicrobium pacificus]|uniref:DUF2849 domain-containing protein n=1 Tax=Oceanomicrobium pacificus TaxID=2692916 RepID=A0A6B0TPJ9_9RHOB|nr:DUF2849 domain-containing protein [Oceanomicrobium pacificus]MXU64569.1 DUF2849 domain-containing protein [Oceanomicrobium pacificus]